MTGYCHSNYTGECKYLCHGGVWKEKSNTCTLESGKTRIRDDTFSVSSDCRWCDATTESRCVLSSSSSGSSSAGTCQTGYIGSCSYFCENGYWRNESNSCTYAAASCSATTTWNCSLPRTDDGETGIGTCINNTYGSCSRECKNGRWLYSSNMNCSSACSYSNIIELQRGNCHAHSGDDQWHKSHGKVPKIHIKVRCADDTEKWKHEDCGCRHRHWVGGSVREGGGRKYHKHVSDCSHTSPHP